MSHGIPRVSEQEPKTVEARQKEIKKIEEYKSLASKIQEATKDGTHLPATLPLTSKLLTLNPEYYTIWNTRRRILSQHFSSILSESSTSEEEISNLLSSELNFLFPLLLKFPKCYWLWNHRVWTLQQTSTHLSPASSRKFWTDELSLVTKMLARDSRNFHGWGYRKTVVAELESPKLAASLTSESPSSSNLEQADSQPSPETSTSTSIGTSMLESEFAYTTRMISTNLSNFSAWHTRSRLIPPLLAHRHASPSSRRQMLDSELELILNALYTDPYDQSIWFYHSFLISAFSTSAFQQELSIVPDLTDQERIGGLEGEIEKVMGLMEEEEGCRWVYERGVEMVLEFVELKRGEEGGKVVPEGVEGGWDEVARWRDRLEELDPLRRGRWRDLGEKIRRVRGEVGE
ncbi:Rab geranylgeranyltransferase [Thelotrema lepadinum]|nr:Rab geranylgeranyltransferase [Thelotrema lepadinum]